MHVVHVEEVDHFDRPVARHDGARSALEAGRTEPVPFQRRARGKSFDGRDAIATTPRLAIGKGSAFHPQIIDDRGLLVGRDGTKKRYRDERENDRDEELGKSNAHELTGVSAEVGRSYSARGSKRGRGHTSNKSPHSTPGSVSTSPK
jgi:hypothetical protein